MFERVTAYVLLGGLGLVNVANAVGDGETMLDNPINSVLQFGAFGVLCMLVLHVFRHTIPRLAKGYETNLKAERESNVEQLAQAREDYKDMLNGQRKDFIDEMRLERASNEHKLEELTKAVQELTRQVQRIAGMSRATSPRENES